MSSHQHASCASTSDHLLLAALLLASFVASAPAAARPQHKATPKPDLASDFGVLAQQRPRACAGAATSATFAAGWKTERSECAWQNLLQVRRWSAVDAAPGGNCVSAQAQWWARVTPVGQLHAWRSTWTAQGMADDSAAQKRIAIIERTSGGLWRATEWRWQPSPREATRRWQEGRWKMLAAHAERFRQPASSAGLREIRMLQSVWERNLGTRAGEINGDTWRWQGDGLCMRTESIGLGQQQFHIPYAVEDGRLEQRAAMQLQLARRYPKAQWLTPFRLLPAAPHGRGARFAAVWIENSELKGQLWIPTKGDGPVVLLRINASLPAAAGAQPSPAVVALAAPIVERELSALAERWTAEYD